jgi:uncharacterized protein
MTLADLRRAAVTQTLFPPTTLKRALEKCGFVQADPIRSPARAQDLMLRHRVARYRAGDLDRRYADLDVHEDVFVNYGFVTGAVQRTMHPRRGPAPWTAARGRQVQTLLEFVRTRGSVHPREVDAHFAYGAVTNYWGGSSSATTHLLEAMHYRGLLRVVRRDAGIRIYAACDHPTGSFDAATRRAHLDALVDVIVGNYAPLPAASLSMLVRRLRYAVPQWDGELGRTLERSKRRLTHARVEGVDWYGYSEASPANEGSDEAVRLLAPFDPVIWDRRRFELLWGWPYRFEAYTPAPARKFGYYALPLLWRDRVIGWANLSVKEGRLHAEFGFVASRPREAAFRHALEEEMSRFRSFLGLAA